MNLQLHSNACTTPAIRLELQAQPRSISSRELAETYNLNRHTVAKWHQAGYRRCFTPPPSAPRHAQRDPGSGGA